MVPACRLLQELPPESGRVLRRVLLSDANSQFEAGWRSGGEYWCGAAPRIWCENAACRGPKGMLAGGQHGGCVPAWACREATPLMACGVPRLFPDVTTR